jgi:hypothetical protein
MVLRVISTPEYINERDSVYKDICKDHVPTWNDDRNWRMLSIILLSDRYSNVFPTVQPFVHPKLPNLNPDERLKSQPKDAKNQARHEMSDA